MTIEEAKKLVDLFVDDELPMELAGEFKQAMFEHSDLREEVSALRQTKEAFSAAFSHDAMTPAEFVSVEAKIYCELGIPTGFSPPIARQMRLPIGSDNPMYATKQAEV